MSDKSWKNVILSIIFSFMMSLTRVQGESSTPLSNDRMYDPSKDIFSLYPYQAKKAPEQWFVDTNKGEKEQLIRLEETEPGFDLTDEEIKKLKMWPKGLIPYYIDDVSFDKVLRDRLRGFLDSVKALTGIYFAELPTPPTDETERWVFFINRRGVLECSDYTTDDFTNEGVQKILVGYDCFINLGRLSGTMLGLVGVPPMHNAPDRKWYLEIMDDNILPDKKDMFKVMDDKAWLFHDINYDYASAGHYHYHQYTATGNMTMKPRVDINYEVGQRTHFSYVDAWKIRMLYNYISKHKGVKASVSECNKLFVPGEKFDTYVPESDEELKPRSKPLKYLGIEKVLQKPPTSAEIHFNENTTNHNESQTNEHNVTQEVSVDNKDGTKETTGINNNGTQSKEKNGKHDENEIKSAKDNKETQHEKTEAKTKNVALKKYRKRHHRNSKTISPFDLPDLDTFEI